jgi:ATP-binding cassette subfamily B protein
MKPFAFVVLLAVVLLFVQNISDLMLPNYMSEIVNTGIMRGGVEDDVPEVLSGNARRLVTAFMPEEDRSFFENAYAPYSGGTDEKLGKRYPALEQMDAYVLMQTDEGTKGRLAFLYGKAVSAFSSYALGQLGAMESGNEAPAETDLSKVDVSMLYNLLDNLDEGAVAESIAQAQSPASLVQTESASPSPVCFTASLAQI